MLSTPYFSPWLHVNQGLVTVATAVVIWAAIVAEYAPILTQVAKVMFGEFVGVRNFQHRVRLENRFRNMMNELAKMLYAEFLIILRIHQKFMPTAIDRCWGCDWLVRHSA